MMGHAAGIAAAMSIKEKVAIHDINHKILTEKLVDQKAVLDARVFE